MVAREIQIPDFNFSAFYYADLLEALLEFKRRNVPELTDESDFEPFIQLLRMTALVGHSNNTLTDLVRQRVLSDHRAAPGDCSQSAPPHRVRNESRYACSCRCRV